MTSLDARPLTPTEPYDRLTRAFHWATAVLVVLLYGLYLAWEQTPKGTAHHLAIVLHMSLGIALTAVLFGRIAWRLSPRSVPQPHAGGLEGFASRGVHLLLYGLLVVQAVSGWNFRWAQGEELSFFGLLISSPYGFPPGIRHVLALVHYWSGTSIMVLALLHATAALVHHHVLRDSTLGRMVGRFDGLDHPAQRDAAPPGSSPSFVSRFARHGRP